jgi:hypothetical protein
LYPDPSAAVQRIRATPPAFRMRSRGHPLNHNTRSPDKLNPKSSQTRTRTRHRQPPASVGLVAARCGASGDKIQFRRSVQRARRATSLRRVPALGRGARGTARWTGGVAEPALTPQPRPAARRLASAVRGAVLAARALFRADRMPPQAPGWQAARDSV